MRVRSRSCRLRLSADLGTKSGPISALGKSEREKGRVSRCFLMQEAGRERNPNTGMEALVVALLEPVARRARRQALGLMQTV